MKNKKRMSFHKGPRWVQRKAPISKPKLKPNPKQSPKNKLIKRKPIFKTQANAFEQEGFRLVNPNLWYPGTNVSPLWDLRLRR